MRVRLGICAILALLCPMVSPLAGQQVQVEEFTLDNGMKFLLVPRTDQPNVISAGWLAKVGSVNERPGITGISHFFEHMMFKGTRTIGTEDPQKDLEYIREQEITRTSLRELTTQVQYQRWREGEIANPWDPAEDTGAMSELRARMRELQESQRDITVKNEFDQVYTSMGASGLNAFTSYDITFYIINLPSNRLELWTWMESDRLDDSVFREFYTERDVVHEERRLRTESTPTGRFQEQFNAMFWHASPYAWPVIGWPTDLNSYTREQAVEYFKTYYAPNNLCGVIVGDFDPAEAKTLITKYFSRLERGPEPPPVVTLEIEQLAEQRMYAEGDFQPQIEVRYHSVPFGHKDEPALEVLSNLLNGRTGRLYRGLIEGSQVAASASTGQDSRKYGGAFSFRGECKGDATPEDLEQGWYQELEKLQNEPVGEKELQKIKNQNLAESYRRLQSNFFLMIQLGFYESLDDWTYINEYPKQLQQVTADDVQRVAKTYFDPANRSVAIYRRAEGTGEESEDPELAALDGQAKIMVKQVLGQVAQETDPEKLRAALERFDEQKEQVPPEFAAAMEYLVKKIRARLDELESAKN